LEWREEVIELTLDHAPAQLKLGTAMSRTGEIRRGIRITLTGASVCIIASARSLCFSRAETYASLSTARQFQRRTPRQACALFRTHPPVLNALDSAPFVTIAAFHGAFWVEDLSGPWLAT